MFSAHIGDDIHYAASVIRRGGLVAFPTETVYGLGANSLNAYAVAKIFEIKKRPYFDPLIVHIAEVSQLEFLFETPLPDWIKILIDKFWPGPLTIVYKKNISVPEIVTSGLTTIGVRYPSHPIAQQLINLAGTPIAAPSANKFGHLSPTRAEHVLKQLPEVDYILKSNVLVSRYGIESTVVTFEKDSCIILRPGGITAEQIQQYIPCKHLSDFSSSIISPGMIKSHYSPNKPLFILSDEYYTQYKNNYDVGFIFHGNKYDSTPNCFYTSQSYNYKEIAVHLFEALHQMEDNPEIVKIFIEPVEEKGLGVAIMDRIRKATFRYQKFNS